MQSLGLGATPPTAQRATLTLEDRAVGLLRAFKGQQGKAESIMRLVGIADNHIKAAQQQLAAEEKQQRDSIKADLSSRKKGRQHGSD